MGKRTSTCTNCGKKIYCCAKPDDEWQYWLHSADGSNWCPGKVATPTTKRDSAPSCDDNEVSDIGRDAS